MEEYEPRKNEPEEAAPAEDGSNLVAELSEQTDPGFVTETANPTRNATLVLITLLALGAGAIYLMRMRTGPATAAAATPESASANAAISAFLSDGSKNMRSMQDLLRNTEKVVQQFLSYPTMTQVTLDELKTNPFQFSAPKKDNGDEDEAKRKKDEELRKQKEKEAVVKAVGQLKLQSVMSGKIATCMISNRAYTEGQQVDGFTIEKITTSTVIVKKSGYRFELRMQQ